MKVLFYHTGALGDFVTTLPAVSTWKQVYPDARIVLFGKPQFGELGAAFNLVDETMDLTAQAYASLFADNLLDSLHGLLRSFTHALIFSDNNSPIINHCRNAGLTVVHQQPFPEDRTPVIDYHLSILQTGGLSRPVFGAPRSVSPMEQVEVSLPADRKIVAIHPGSGSARKNWPYDRFVTLCGILRQKGFFILWIIGPSEHKHALPPPHVDRVLSSPRLPELGAILARCSLFIGNDSGAAHLAAFTGCPVLALFGASDPGIWSPRGGAVRIVYRKAGCAPCHPGALPSGCDHSCMRSITVAEVTGEALGLCRIDSL